MKYIFLWYPKCTTCQKARKWLEENNIVFEERHIVENNPSKKELKTWINQSDYDIKRFFNTSGLKYKELNLKEQLPSMSNDDKLKLLSTDGMLIKRPLLILEDNVLVGFSEEKWNEILEKED